MHHLTKFEELTKICQYDRRLKEIRDFLSFAKEYDFIKENNICYAKNLFLFEKTPILFIFNSETIYKISRVMDCDNEIIEVEILERIDIKNIRYYNNLYGEAGMLKFNINNTEYEFDSREDTNEHHMSNYNQVIKEIFEYILS